tara:strand:+ start:366 stop:752 length:387 start_codon:yes stop_codon:yes gene_type:complete
MACEKPSGEGGTSIIEGKIIYFTSSYNTVTGIVDTHYYPKVGKDVYIIYSDDRGGVYDDKFDTDYNGKYHFEYLRKGEYTIYTYVDSFILNNIGNPIVTYDHPIYRDIKITNNNSTNTVDDFIIEKNQ